MKAEVSGSLISTDGQVVLPVVLKDWDKKKKSSTLLTFYHNYFIIVFVS